MSVVTELNVEEFSRKHTNIKYPNFILNNINETTPLVVSLLEEGEIPLIGIHNGVKKVVKYISNSAYNVDKILRTHGVITYVLSESDSKVIKRIQDYLEVFIWTY